MSEKPSQEMKDAVRLPIVILGDDSEVFSSLIKREFKLDDAKKIIVVDSVFEGDDTLLYLSFVRDVAIVGTEMREASGLVVELGGTLTLRFDKKGELVAYSMNDQQGAGIQETKTGVIGLLNEGKIYFAKPGEKVDVSKLARERIPFYMQEDNDGTKRLFRAYVS